MYKKAAFWLILLVCCVSAAHSEEFIIDEPGSYYSPQPKKASPSRDSLPYLGSLPTPDNFRQGQYYSEFLMYDQGGVGIRLNVGVFNILSIGVAENFDHVIGSEPIHVNLPSAYIRFSFWEPVNHLNYAFGFDSFAYGSNGSYTGPDGLSSTMYGFYFTLGKSYQVFSARNMFTAGLRVPLLPAGFRHITNSSVFLGATLGSRVFKTGLTLENLYLNFSRPASILPSLLFRFSPIQGFEMGLTLQYQISDNRVNRIFNLSYSGSL